MPAQYTGITLTAGQGFFERTYINFPYPGYDYHPNDPRIPVYYVNPALEIKNERYQWLLDFYGSSLTSFPIVTFTLFLIQYAEYNPAIKEAFLSYLYRFMPASGDLVPLQCVDSLGTNLIQSNPNVSLFPPYNQSTAFYQENFWPSYPYNRQGRYPVTPIELVRNYSPPDTFVSNFGFGAIQLIRAHYLLGWTDTMLVDYANNRPTIGQSFPGFDISRFAQFISASQSYISQSNDYINAANNSGLYDPVFNFPGENNLITANFSDLSSDLTKFGTGFSRAGLNINLRNINNLGSPATVIQNLNIGGGVPNSVITALLNQGITSDVIANMVDVNYSVSRNDNLNTYNALLTITGDNLTQCLKILKCTTVGLTSLADVLNPAKLFPNSYLTMTVRYSNSVYQVYSGNYTINPILPILGSRLDSIIPPDQAQAWYALERDLNAVKGIENMTAKTAGTLMLSIETVTDLPLIASFDQYVPTNTQAYWNQAFGMGSGLGNTVTARDCLGSVAGYPNLLNITSAFNSLNFDLLLGNEQSNTYGVYGVMLGTLGGTYGNNPTVIPSGYPGAGTYANIEIAFYDGLIPAANSAMTTIVSTNPEANLVIWNTWNEYGNQFLRENAFLQVSGFQLPYANVPLGGDANTGPIPTAENLQPANANLWYLNTGIQNSSEPATLALISSLHAFGLDDSNGGYSELLTNLANTQTIYGQAVIASLREGRNIVKIDAAGVQLDAGLDPTPTP